MSLRTTRMLGIFTCFSEEPEDLCIYLTCTSTDSTEVMISTTFQLNPCRSSTEYPQTNNDHWYLESLVDDGSTYRATVAPN